MFLHIFNGKQALHSSRPTSLWAPKEEHIYSNHLISELCLITQPQQAPDLHASMRRHPQFPTHWPTGRLGPAASNLLGLGLRVFRTLDRQVQPPSVHAGRARTLHHLANLQPCCVAARVLCLCTELVAQCTHLQCQDTVSASSAQVASGTGSGDSNW